MQDVPPPARTSCEPFSLFSPTPPDDVIIPPGVTEAADKLKSAWSVTTHQLSLQLNRQYDELRDLRLIGTNADGVPVLWHPLPHIANRYYRNIRRVLSDALATETEIQIIGD